MNNMHQGTTNVNLREYFKHAVFEFWSKIQKWCLRLQQHLFHFFKT